MRAVGLTLLIACGALLGTPAQGQDCSTLQSRICTHTTGTFEPNPSSGSSNAADSPSCGAPAAADQIAAIQAAVDLAPGKVKTELCKVTLFFVSSRSAWGRWEAPWFHPNTPGKTEIAINTNDKDKTFSGHNNDHLKNLGPGGGSGLSAHGTYTEDINTLGRVDPKTYGLLYRLAHELGHIIWHRELGVGNSIGCADGPNFYSWLDISDAKGRRWAQFGNESDNDTHKRGPVQKPSKVTNPAGLAAIYTGGFVTALAAANPEEDFVESYAVRALIAVCPTCIFNIVIGTTTIRVNDDGGQPELRSKFNCVYDKYIK